MQILGRKNVRKMGKTSFFGVRRLAGTSASTGQKNVQIQFGRNRRRQAEYQNPEGEEAHMDEWRGRRGTQMQVRLCGLA